MAEHEKQAVNTAPADVEVGSAEDVEACLLYTSDAADE